MTNEKQLIVTTYTGKDIDLFKYDAQEHFNLKDVVHVLANLPRYNATTELPVTVLAHSLNVHYCCYSIVGSKQALLHDVVEAYLGDLIAPVKAFMPEYRSLETSILSSILEYHNLPPQLTAEVHVADQFVRAVEATDNWDHKIPHVDYDLLEVYARPLIYISPRIDSETVKQRFIAHYNEMFLVTG